MDIQTKHRLELLNAKCNYVCAVDILQKKMSYGEDVSCCINKLYLAQKLIGRLECFCFETPVVETEILAKFEITIPNNNFAVGNITIQLIVNGVYKYSEITSGGLYKPTFFDSFFTNAGYTYTKTTASTTLYVINFECNTTEVALILTLGTESSFTKLDNVNFGACVTSNPPCYNCIENSDLPKMYEVLHKLLQ
jgi:hypothetical protein